MKFSDALVLLSRGVVVQHKSWEPTSKLWYDEAQDIFRVSTRRGDFIWLPESSDLLSHGWEAVPVSHDVVLEHAV